MDIEQLCDACKDGDNSLVQAIMDTGEVDVNSHHDGCTPLYYAMGINYPNIVTTLLSSADTRLDVTSRDSCTGLHLACLENSLSVIKVFCSDYRCTPTILNLKNLVGDSALMNAVFKGNLDVVQEMSKLDGVDFDTENEQGLTLLEVARKKEHLHILQFLEERSQAEHNTAQVEKTTATSLRNTDNMDIEQLCDACRAGDNSLVQAIMDTGEVDVNSHLYGHTPLYYAMGTNYPSVVTTLLSSADTRLDVTSRPCDGRNTWTGLHLACCDNSLSVIKLFCSDYRCTPAILNMKDMSGDSALMNAVLKGNIDVVQEMSKLDGVDFGTKNDQGKTLLETAREKQHWHIVQFLEERSQAEHNTTQVETSTAKNTLNSLSLREIAEELENIEAMEALLESEEQVMMNRHTEEITRLDEKQKKEEHENRCAANKIKRNDLEKKLQAKI